MKYTVGTEIENESWLVNYEWTGELAWISKILNIKFIFTSTAMVFSNNAKGPFTVDSIPDETIGYGYEKFMAEKRVFHQNSNAYVVRLGWQIGDADGNNNMVDFLENKMKNEDRILVSTKWYPACSFLDDTVKTLVDITSFDSGLYLLDSNKKWNLYEIACALKNKLNKEWDIIPTDDFVYDQRMIDERVIIAPISSKLCDLK